MPDGSQITPQTVSDSSRDLSPTTSAARAARTQPCAVRTLFTTEHAFDAGMAGFDGPTAPGTDGGFSVTFDGRSVPSIVLVGSDGQIEVCGLAAIKQLTDALMGAEQLARRMSA